MENFHHSTVDVKGLSLFILFGFDFDLAFLEGGHQRGMVLENLEQTIDARKLD